MIWPEKSKFDIMDSTFKIRESKFNMVYSKFNALMPCGWMQIYSTVLYSKRGSFGGVLFARQ